MAISVCTVAVLGSIDNGDGTPKYVNLMVSSVPRGAPGESGLGAVRLSLPDGAVFDMRTCDLIDALRAVSIAQHQDDPGRLPAPRPTQHPPVMVPLGGQRFC